jgi:hypothetical protein
VILLPSERSVFGNLGQRRRLERSLVRLILERVVPPARQHRATAREQVE